MLWPAGLELRAILNVLRQADEADPTAPVPGVSQLETLVAGACQAGLQTRLTVSGTPLPLPAPVDLAAYRIVQESLTNAIRHAGPATAAVSVQYDPDALLIEVADTGLAGVKVIILTTFESDEYIYQALRAGASGFLVKD